MMNRTNSTKGKMYAHPATIKLLTDATWEFAHSILWNNQPFSEAETDLAKFYIREYYEAIPAEQFTQTASSHFSAYCERIILARDYVSRHSYRFIPHPCIWHNRLYSKGFAGTRKWYEHLIRKRQLLKLFSQTGLGKGYARSAHYTTF